MSCFFGKNQTKLRNNTLLENKSRKETCINIIRNEKEHMLSNTTHSELGEYSAQFHTNTLGKLHFFFPIKIQITKIDRGNRKPKSTTKKEVPVFSNI